ncbi:MAG: penicillin-binding transpeptidase domain-containing protein [Lachnospiraceae bacterium]|nr:penicillin-binding transpeptidase domain-containing protein [Lachnospiraceae bacterium]
MAFIFAGLFLALMIYLIRFQVYDSAKVSTSPYNKRLAHYGENILKGTILSADGKELAETTIDENGNEIREYPYGRTFAHVIGFDSHGKSGLESTCNYQLLTSSANPFVQLFNGLRGDKNPGDNVITTLDTRLQKAAYKALGDYKGAVVAMDPQTGEVLAMVSRPDFNPNKIDEKWDSYVSDDSKSNLLNRATQGLYPPGSTFKVLTALEFIQENPKDYEDYSYYCDSTILKNSVKISCFGGSSHGEVNLAQSLAKSCNTSFVNIGVGLNQNQFRNLCETFLYNQEIPFTLPTKSGSYSLSSDSEKSEIPQTVIGQGDTLVTPLQNALIISAIANDGVLMEPYLISAQTDYTGEIVKEYEPQEYKRLISTEDAQIMQKLLRKVVKNGTAEALKSDKYKAAGKTGSAENGSGDDHAWFIGYANLDNPDIAVSVIVENAGAGSKYAVPIAKKIFDCYYNNSMDEE